MSKPKLTPKQKLFADYYIENPNASEAARRAGYSPKTAFRSGQENMQKPAIRAYIAEMMEKKAEKRIAQQDEILSYLSSIMRGEQQEQVLRGVGEGAQTIDEMDVTAKDRIKAAELLLKRFPANKAEQLREDLIAAQVKKVTAEAERLLRDDDSDGAFEIIVKRKGVDD